MIAPLRSVSDDSIECLVVHGGILHDNKSVNLPDTMLPMATADPKGREDITRELHFAAENDIDYNRNAVFALPLRVPKPALRL